MTILNTTIVTDIRAIVITVIIECSQTRDPEVREAVEATTDNQDTMKMSRKDKIASTPKEILDMATSLIERNNLKRMAPHISKVITVNAAMKRVIAKLVLQSGRENLATTTEQGATLTINTRKCTFQKARANSSCSRRTMKLNPTNIMLIK